MRAFLLAGAAVAAVLASAAVGYRLGVGVAPQGSHAHSDGTAPAPQAADTRARTVLYWKHPDGLADYSPTPAKTADGRDFVPVYDDEEAGFESGKPAPGTAAPEGRRILYYRNPMGLPDTSPVPKKDWMGMDYIPVYEGDADAGATVRVSLDKVQRAGVRTEPARLAKLVHAVRAPGIAKPDERTLRVVSLRADSFIEKLYVNETGQHVHAGQPLFRIYSPQMVTAQINYQVAARDRTPMGTRGAEQQLQNLEVPPGILDTLRRTGEPVMAIDWPAPVSGVVMEKRIVEGQMARMGDELLRFADLATIWVIADVPEQDLGDIRIGDPATVRFRAIPDASFEGPVTFILHEIDAATRTAKVRIEIRNPDDRIMHEMYADVEIDAGAKDLERIAVPASAVIDSGNRQVVLVARGEGLFEPRPVKPGRRGDGLIEIREGLKPGEQVVVAATFLIDAESNLKAALSAFTAEAEKASAEPAPKTETTP